MAPQTRPLARVIAALSVLAAPSMIFAAASAPTVTVTNGSYTGLYLPGYHQDAFLGLPFAQPPVGALRYHVPVSLNTTWTGTKPATEYGNGCIGFGSGDNAMAQYLAEDCLNLNIVRPSGIKAGANLPVAIWVYGGNFEQGANRDVRYNTSFIVNQSSNMGTPMIAVAINYRVDGYGFLFSQDLLNAGATNLGLRDQRLAFRWVKENIAAFGGDPNKVTIWGESAGAYSVGAQLVAYGGRDDGLFRAAISESGSPAGWAAKVTTQNQQPYYAKLLSAVNCTNATDSVACLRTVPVGTLSNVFNSTLLNGISYLPQEDGDFLQASGVSELKNGHFVKVPYLIGTNFDEGTAFNIKACNTTDQFISALNSEGVDNATALTIAALYPDIPEIGIPATLAGRPPASLLTSLGSMWKRTASYTTDLLMSAPRRLTTESWAAYNATAYTYRFNVLPSGYADYIGVTHFSEVAFVFYNLQGDGYTPNPFANKSEAYTQVADMMSRMWVSFIVNLDPNQGQASCLQWPKYSLDNPQNIVFDTNVTRLAYLEKDFYRAEAISYLVDRLQTVYDY